MTVVEKLRSELEKLPDEATVIVELHNGGGSIELREITSLYHEDQNTFPVLRLVSL